MELGLFIGSILMIILVKTEILPYFTNPYLNFPGYSWQNFKCRKDKHVIKYEDANFCTNCGHALKDLRDIYSNYEVLLGNGESIVVKAVNEHNARSIVIYGVQDGQEVLLDENGKVIGQIKVSPENIKKVIKLSPV